MPYENILTNLLPHLESWWFVLELLFYLLGFGLFVLSLAKLVGSRRDKAWGELALALAAGILLINSPALLDSLSRSLFGHSSVQSLSYRPPEHPARVYIQFSFYVIALVGLIGVGRGIFILKDASIRPGQLSRALVHIFGGVLCINLESTLTFLARTMGSHVQGLVASIIVH
jgi:hypothetical protein